MSQKWSTRFGSGEHELSQWYYWYIVVHHEEPRTHCTSVGSDSGPKNFILIPNGSQGAISCSLYGYTSPDHPWRTTKSIMLNNLTGSITFFTSSLDRFTSVTCAQDGFAPICEVQGTSGGSANSSILWQMPVGFHAAGQWAQARFCLFHQAYSHQWRSFYSAVAVVVLFNIPQRSRHW